MKKILLVSSILLSALAVESAQASYLPVVQTMVSFGVADKATVLNNIHVYHSILTSIEKNIRSRKFVQSQINDLSRRLNSQMSIIGYDFSSVIAPELESALDQSKTANAKNDIQTLRKNIAEAKKQLTEISNNI